MSNKLIVSNTIQPYLQRMSRFLICLLIFAIVDLSFSGIILTTCARMNVPILQKAAQEMRNWLLRVSTRAAGMCMFTMSLEGTGAAR
ncbi:hypothetical protein ANCCEY_11586 [Ancylostoma ceylanicum]|uniref:Uncharacterized protein n=1 Tax=Ancylostoma ceylanicum TaxID=53326 RepID=A0A0D6LHD2_9BILA|nr:hypothetical protein ANCCEY_11586 [Ancylostoma ceylanicum]